MTKIINFATRFSSDVERGLKGTTIRDESILQRVSLGDDLRLFTGLGTAADERFLGDAVCVELEKITLDQNFCAIGQNQLTAENRQALAKAEGFDSYAELYAWLCDHYGVKGQFHGRFIRWELKAQAKRQVAA